MRGDFCAVKGGFHLFAVKGEFTILIKYERQEMWFFSFLSLSKNTNTTEKKEKEFWLLRRLWGRVQIDGRKSCMGFADVLLREHVLLWFFWLGSNLDFLKDKDQEEVLYPIKNQVDGLKSHVWAMLDREEVTLGGDPPRSFNHLVEFCCSRVSLQKSFVARVPEIFLEFFPPGFSGLLPLGWLPLL